MLQKTFLTPFYISTFCQSVFKLITPFYVIYFFSLGLDFRQIALISSFRSIIGLLFEIPTGVIADLYGKKFSVILGYILSALTLFLIPLTESFLRLSAIFCFDALFQTLFTGSDNAWVADRIEQEDPSQMRKFFLRQRSIRNLGYILAGLGGGLVVKFLGMDYLRYIYGLGILLSAFILFWAPDGNKGYEEEGEALRSKKFWQHIKKSFEYVKQHKILWFLFGAMGLFLIVDELLGLIWAPYMETLGFSIENLGYLASIIGVIGIGVPLLVEKLLQKKKNPAFILSGTIGIFIVLLGIAGRYSALRMIIGVYLLHHLIDDILFPVDTMLTNSLVEKNKRATVLSMKSVVENLSSIIGAPLMGVILGYISFAQGLFIAGGLMLMMVVLYACVRRRTGQPLKN